MKEQLGELHKQGIILSSIFENVCFGIDCKISRLRDKTDRK